MDVTSTRAARRCRGMIAAAPLCLLACLTTPPPIPRDPDNVDASTALERVDWQQAGDEAFTALAGYLRVDTSNPPGNETEGANFLTALLEREGIEAQIFEQVPGRGSLLARLRGSGAREPLCLVSHIDVATAEPELWPANLGPFSGEIDADDQVYGRGAIDMKGMTILELYTMVWLKRLGVPLARDVILLAVADEEAGNDGMRYMVEQHWDELGCSHAINEGGLGLIDAFFEGQTVFGIGVGDKGLLWLRVKATGEPGHGSTPVPGRAPERLLEAIGRIEGRLAKPEMNPALRELMFQIGGNRGGLEGVVMQQDLLVDTLLVGQLMEQPTGRALITNTVNLTGLGTAREPNVVPGEMFAQYDVRVLPGTDPGLLLAELEALVADIPGVSIEVIASRAGNQSPWDDPLYRALARHAVMDRGNAVAGPALSPGFTDSIFLRDKGVHAYGMMPIAVTVDEAMSQHGPGERLSRDNVREGLRALFGAVVEVSAAP